jgi:hypothetical protein
MVSWCSAGFGEISKPSKLTYFRTDLLYMFKKISPLSES